MQHVEGWACSHLTCQSSNTSWRGGSGAGARIAGGRARREMPALHFGDVGSGSLCKNDEVDEGRKLKTLEDRRDTIQVPT